MKTLTEPIQRDTRFATLFSGARAAWIVLAISLGITAVATYLSRSHAVELARGRFERQTASIQRRIVGDLHDYEQVLRGAQGLFAASKSVERDEWRAYCEGVAIERDFPGVRGLGFVADVRASGRDAFLAETRKDGAPQFTIRPEGPRPDYFVVKYIEPASRSAARLGYDIGSEPRRREAAERARDTGLPATSARVTLVADTDPQVGVLLLLPVYRKGMPHATVAERRAAIQGWVYAPFRIRDLVSGVTDAEAAGIDMDIFDDDTASGATVLYDTDRSVAADDDKVITAKDYASRTLFTSSSIPFGGRVWRLHFSSEPSFDATIDRAQSLTVAATGGVVSLLLFTITWSLANTRQRSLRLAEEMTKELRLKDRAILSSSNMVLITDPTKPDNPVVFVNPAFERITGYSSTEIVGENCRILQGPDRHQPGLDELRQAVGSGRSCRVTLRNRRKDGRMFWNELNISPVRDDDGKLTHFVGVARDITQRKAAEQRLALQYEVTRVFANANTLAEAIPEILRVICEAMEWTVGGLWMADAEGAHLRCERMWSPSGTDTEAFLEMSRGMSFAPGVGLPGRVWSRNQPVWIADVVKDSNFPRAGAASRGGLHSAVGFPIRKRGEVIGVMEFFGRDILDPDELLLRMLDSVGAQISSFIERKKGEEAAHAVEERLRSLVEHANDIIYRTDAEGRFTFVNPSAIRLMNYSEKELLGLRFTDLIRPDRREEMERFYGRQFVRKTPNTYREFPAVDKDGNEIWLGQNVQPILLEGKVTGFQAVARNITEHKQMEIALARARDDALESARLKSEFLANMSHEIRTPMNGIIGMTGLLLESPLQPEQREFANTVRSCADSLLGIINDILDFSKIEAGKLIFETLDFDLRSTVEGACEALAEQAQSRGLELGLLIYEDTPPLLRGDPGRLRQVLTNLLGNSIKFTRQGEVIVRVSKKTETDSHAEILFSILDTGIGIPIEGQKRLFQAFSQADGSTTRQYGGTGLGLAISRQLVERMGGAIGVKSEPGKGSLFWFTAVFEKQKISPAPTSHAVTRWDHARVLIVDDNETNRKILDHQIRSWGMHPVDVPGGREALARLREDATAGHPFSLAILDMRMPEMDGMTLARAIKADPLLNKTPLVMLTSYGRREIPDGSANHVLEACMTKPVKQSQLLDCISNVLGAHRDGPSRGRDAAPTVERVSPAPLRAAGIRVLVVEDNVVNQKVAVRQLVQLGCKADAVSNGIEALDALLKIPYGVVLMDCQMPEMDGYEATAEIRRREGDRGHTPIIAMTANVMEGDREKCLSAGMDDYVGKPVKTDDLRRVLERWGGPSARGGAGGRASGARAVVVDMEQLRSAAGGDGGVRELAEMCRDQTIEAIVGMKAAVAAGEAVALERFAHSAAGSSATCGMVALAEALREIECAARENRIAEAPAILARVEREFSLVQTYIEEQLPCTSNAS